MIYISYGIPKSASTYTHLLTDAVLRTAGYSTIVLSDAAKGRKSDPNYVDPINGEALDRVRSAIGDGSVVIKTHSAPDRLVIEEVDGGRVFASAAIRDPREVALSLIDHGERSRSQSIADFAEFRQPRDTMKLLDDQYRRLMFWLQSRRVLVVPYDEVSFDTEQSIQRIARQIGASVSAADVLRLLPRKSEIAQFNKGQQRRYEAEMSLELQREFLDRYENLYRMLQGFSGAGGPREGAITSD